MQYLALGALCMLCLGIASEWFCRVRPQQRERALNSVSDHLYGVCGRSHQPSRAAYHFFLSQVHCPCNNRVKTRTSSRYAAHGWLHVPQLVGVPPEELPAVKAHGLCAIMHLCFNPVTPLRSRPHEAASASMLPAPCCCSMAPPTAPATCTAARWPACASSTTHPQPSSASQPPWSSNGWA